jgi:hypothetical protein
MRFLNSLFCLGMYACVYFSNLVGRQYPEDFMLYFGVLIVFLIMDIGRFTTEKKMWQYEEF